MSLLTKTERSALLFLACCLAAVSVVCEVMLFTSHTNNRLDFAIAAVTGFALVGFQYVFAETASRFWQHNQKAVSCLMFFVTAVLFAVSVSGTAGFFESRFVSITHQTIQTSDQYQLQRARIEQLAQQEKELRNAANKASEKGNSWYAGQLLEKAKQSNTDQQTAINTLANINAEPNTTANALAGLFGSHRWALWWVLAALIDACPVLSFAVYSLKRQTQTPTRKPKQTQAQTQTKSKHPNIKQFKEEIKRINTDTVGVRQSMAVLNTTNHQKTKQALEELVTEGVLVHHGKQYKFATDQA